ncbi:MAG: hypothetical protein JXN59_17515 [Anaerolineae bacterium]|nr:hypothetical protein [Anaerolineae bacterium]
MENSVSVPQIFILMLVLGGVALILLLAAFFMWQRKPGGSKETRRHAASKPTARPRRQTTNAAAMPVTERGKIPMGADKQQPVSSSMPQAAQAPPDAVEVMRLYRDSGGALIMQIDGEHYQTMGDIKQAGQERSFMALLRELARIAKETEDIITPRVRVEDAAAATLAEPGLVSEALPTAEAEPAVERQSPELLGALPAAGEPESEPIGTLFDNFRKAVQPGKRAEAGAYQPPLSIPEQIDAILQRKLIQSPEYSGRDIRISPSSSGGVQIQVGTDVYESVSEIADEGIRAFVESAIRDWERHG